MLVNINGNEQTSDVVCNALVEDGEESRAFRAGYDGCSKPVIERVVAIIRRLCMHSNHYSQESEREAQHLSSFFSRWEGAENVPG